MPEAVSILAGIPRRAANLTFARAPFGRNMEVQKGTPEKVVVKTIALDVRRATHGGSLPEDDVGLRWTLFRVFDLVFP
jgi:hypothetical protein